MQYKAFTRKHIAAAAIVIVLVAAGVGTFFRLQKSENPPTSTRLHSLPDLTFKDIEGNDVALSSLRGQFVVLDLWASWCSLCTHEMSNLALLQKEFGNALVIIEVNRGESVEVIKKYMNHIDTSSQHIAGTSSASASMGEADHHVRFVRDANDSLYQAIQGFLMPETLFIDKGGTIADHIRGPMDIIEMRRRIQDLLAR